MRDQDPIIVPQAAYNSAYDTTNFPTDTTAYARIQSTSLTFKPLDLSTPAVADQVADAGDHRTSSRRPSRSCSRTTTAG